MHHGSHLSKIQVPNFCNGTRNDGQPTLECPCSGTYSVAHSLVRGRAALSRSDWLNKYLIVQLTKNPVGRLGDLCQTLSALVLFASHWRGR